MLGCSAARTGVSTMSPASLMAPTSTTRCGGQQVAGRGPVLADQSGGVADHPDRAGSRSASKVISPGRVSAPCCGWTPGTPWNWPYLWPSFNHGYSLYDLLTTAQLELSRPMVRYWGALMSLRPGGQTQTIPAGTFAVEHQCSFWDAAG
jgi:hypothetical protein